MTALAPLPVLEFFDDNAEFLIGGKLFTYAAGTTTKINTYTDSTGNTPNTNPIILDARGDCNCWLTVGIAYKFVLSPATDSDPPTNAIWTVDNVNIGNTGAGTVATPITSGSVAMPSQQTVPVNNTSSAPITINWSSSPYDGETHEVIDYAGNAMVYNITVKTSSGAVITTLSNDNQATIITYSSALSGYIVH